MAKKRKVAKAAKASKGAVADVPWMTMAGGLLGNVLGQVISDGIASYIENGGSGEKKKKNSKAIRKLLKQVMLRHGF